MLTVIKGAGDIASGIALRLKHAKFDVVMTDIERPTAIRRTVCFSQAIVNGTAQVDDVKAEKANNAEEIKKILSMGNIAVIADEKAEIIKVLKPEAVVDAILAKENLGTKIDADCHRRGTGIYCGSRLSCRYRDKKRALFGKSYKKRLCRGKYGSTRKYRRLYDRKDNKSGKGRGFRSCV